SKNFIFKGKRKDFEMISSRDFKPLIQKESDFYCPMCNSVKIVKENGKNKCLNCKFIERKKK
ncbi:MAG TPA: hypothetical protein PLI22_08120, partial [Caldisericia bacterium]|nr:hypothetical protein [Caldisericia bacterium]